MQGVARNFFTLAILYAVCGMALGLHMSITHDHSQMPVHAHAMVAGWLMSAVFAFFYHLVPAASSSRLAVVHFWLTAVSGVMLIVGLYFLLAGNAAIEPVVAVGSIVFYAGILLFAWDRAHGDAQAGPGSLKLSPDGTGQGRSVKKSAVR